MDVLNRPAEEFENDQTVEAMWAMKAYEHADIYFNILCSADPKYLKMTPDSDDIIYNTFREVFPDLRVDIINEDELKSLKGKEKWRPFCERFKIVEDYSFGTLLRSNASKDYTEENSILVTRIQFYAIELARNREGVNDKLREIFKPVKEEKD